MKRVLSFLMSVIMIASCLVISVSADDAAAAANVDALIDAIGDVNASEVVSYSGLYADVGGAGDEAGWVEWYARDASRYGPYDIDITYVFGDFEVEAGSAVGFSWSRDCSMWYSFANKRFELHLSSDWSYNPDAKVIAASDTIELVSGVPYTITYSGASVDEVLSFAIALDGVTVLDCPDAKAAMDAQPEIFAEESIRADKLIDSYIAWEGGHVAYTLVDFTAKIGGNVVAGGNFSDFVDSCYDSGYWGNPNNAGYDYNGFDWMVVGTPGVADGYWSKYEGIAVPASVATAAAAYNALTDEQKALVTKKADLDADLVAVAAAADELLGVNAKIDALTAEFDVDLYFEIKGILASMPDYVAEALTGYEAFVVAPVNGFTKLADAAIATIGNVSAAESVEAFETAVMIYDLLDDALKAEVAAKHAEMSEAYAMVSEVADVDAEIAKLDTLAVDSDTVVGGDTLHFSKTPAQFAANPNNRHLRLDFNDDGNLDGYVSELYHVRERFNIYIDEAWCPGEAGVPEDARNSHIAVHSSGRWTGIGYDMGAQRFFFYWDVNWDSVNFDPSEKNTYFYSDVIPLAEDVWHTMEFELHGRTAKAWLNGELVFEFDCNMGTVIDGQETFIIMSNMDCYLHNVEFCDLYTNEYSSSFGVGDYVSIDTCYALDEDPTAWSIATVDDVEISKSVKAKIVDIVASYAVLSSEQKALVADVAKLNDYLAAGDFGGIQFADKAVDDVVAMIDAIGDVTSLDQLEAIDAAKAAYDALTDTQKAKVDTAKLDAAYAVIADLEVVAPLIATIDTFAGLTDDDVTDEITEAVNAAVAEYEALTDAQKALVNNIDVLYKAYDLVNKALGDVNGDDVIDNKDVALIIRHVAGFEVEIDLANADYNEDGEISNKDISMILVSISEAVEA